MPSLIRKTGICLLASLLLLVCAFAQNFDRRARDIVRQMTLDEKIAQLHGIRDETHYRYVPGVPRLGIPALQPNRAISACATVGVIIAPMPIPNIVKPRARPQNLSNQCATKDPCGIGSTPPAQRPKRK